MTPTSSVWRTDTPGPAPLTVEKAIEERSSTGASPAPPCSSIDELKSEEQITVVIRSKDFGLIPIPSWVRYDQSRPPRYSIWLSLLFGVTCTFSVANLYYCQPLLIQLSRSFGVSYSEVSRIPTLLQAGYATGLLFISPLGDLVPRRPLILISTLIPADLTIGLGTAASVLSFQVLSFFIGLSTVAAPILIPLAADLAPPTHRASAMAVVLSGLLLGIVLARVIAGTIAQFASWRVVFYAAAGAQGALLAALWAAVPDYPAKNPGMGYIHVLVSMARLLITEPLLVQACLVLIASDACYTDFWVTLTFILGDAPYHYSTLVIGLFGFIGIFGVSIAPLIGRLVDRLHPWYAAFAATLCLLVVWTTQTAAGGLSVAAIVVVCLGLDLFGQMQQVSLMSAVFEISEAARSRLNALMIFSIFLGQVIGTAAGTHLYLIHGWRASGGIGLGWVGWQVFMLLVRGPHAGQRMWVGWGKKIEEADAVGHSC